MSAAPHPAAFERLSPGRKALVERHVHLVDAIAKYEIPRLCRRIDPDDLRQQGHLGLIRAGATFDEKLAHEKGRTFPDWAKPHIRWGMRKAFRSETRYEKRVLRLAQEAGVEQALHTARAHHPFQDDDSSVERMLDDTASMVSGSFFCALVGGLMRLSGEEGAALREQYALAITVFRDSHTKLSPHEQWVLDRKVQDEMTWDQIVTLAAGPTKGQLRYTYDKAMLVIGEALRAAGIDEAPELEGRPDAFEPGPRSGDGS